MSRQNKHSAVKKLIAIAKRDLTLYRKRKGATSRRKHIPPKGQSLGYNDARWGIVVKEGNNKHWVLYDRKRLFRDFTLTQKECIRLRRYTHKKHNIICEIKPILFASESGVKAILKDSEVIPKKDHLRAYT